MTRPTLTYALAMAAGADAANARMRRAGRIAWDEDDRNFAVEEMHRLCRVAGLLVADDLADALRTCKGGTAQ